MIPSLLLSLAPLAPLRSSSRILHTRPNKPMLPTKPAVAHGTLVVAVHGAVSSAGFAADRQGVQRPEGKASR